MRGTATATLKDHWPNLSLVRLITWSLLSSEWLAARAGINAFRVMISLPLIVRWTRRQSLNSILCLIGRQCSDWGADVTWSLDERSKTSLAAAFITRCKGTRVDAGSSASSQVTTKQMPRLDVLLFPGRLDGEQPADDVDGSDCMLFSESKKTPRLWTAVDGDMVCSLILINFSTEELAEVPPESGIVQTKSNNKQCCDRVLIVGKSTLEVFWCSGSCLNYG